MGPTNVKGELPQKPVPIRAGSLPSGSSGYKISVRFGDQVLQAGFTSVPNLVLNHYAQLGITPAEMLFTIHMWQFRWTERDPYPSLTTIAVRMNVSWRQAHRYANSLKKKRFLTIKSRQEPGRGQVTSEYDFEPLIRAVLKLDRDNPVNAEPDLVEEQETAPRSTPLTGMTGGGMTELTEAPLTGMSDEEYKEQEDPSQEDFYLSNIRKATSLKSENAPVAFSGKTKLPLSFKRNHSQAEERREGKGERGEGFAPIGDTLSRASFRPPPKPYGEERQVIMDYVARFAKEFSDQAPLKTSTTRAYNLFTRSTLPLGAFIGRMYEAQAITKESATAVPKRRSGLQASASQRGRPARNRMAYWFSVLEDRLGLRKPRRNRGEG